MSQMLSGLFLIASAFGSFTKDILCMHAEMHGMQQEHFYFFYPFNEMQLFYLFLSDLLTRFMQS